MRIAIATPLFPPDTAPAASYAKEVASRLKAENEVSVVLYGRLPEAVPGVSLHAVDKQQPLFLRIPSFAAALYFEARSADVIYALNGASVELPLLLVSLVSRTPIVYGISDEAAAAARGPVANALKHAAQKVSACTITAMPLQRPEIHPLEDTPHEAFEEYEKSWQTHLAALTNAFIHDS